MSSSPSLSSALSLSYSIINSSSLLSSSSSAFDDLARDLNLRPLPFGCRAAVCCLADSRTGRKRQKTDSAVEGQDHVRYRVHWKLKLTGRVGA